MTEETPALRLKLARVRKRLTQAELAERAGCSKEIVSLAERGHLPGLTIQRHLGEALDVDPETIWPTVATPA